MGVENKLQKLKDFLDEFLMNYQQLLTYSILLNDEDETSTSWEVTIKNRTNAQTATQILKIDDENDIPQILIYDWFQDVDHFGLAMQLFLGEFLTFVEN